MGSIPTRAVHGRQMFCQNEFLILITVSGWLYLSEIYLIFCYMIYLTIVHEHHEKAIEFTQLSLYLQLVVNLRSEQHESTRRFAKFS